MQEDTEIDRLVGLPNLEQLKDFIPDGINTK